MAIHKTLHQSEVLLDVAHDELRDIVDATLSLLEGRDRLSEGQRSAVEARLEHRPVEPPSDLGHGVGVLRIAHPDDGEPQCVLVRLTGHVRARDGAKLRFLWVVLGPGDADDPPDEELEPFGWMLVDDRFSGDAFGAGTPHQLIRVYERYLEFVETPPEPAEAHLPEELRPTGKLFGGLVADIRRRGAVYGSDIRDGIHPKTLASSFYLYFALIAPAVAFGGLSAVLTDGSIGAIETIVGTAIVGVIYALLAGQPLTIVGSIAPVVVFTGILYGLCSQFGVPFLPTYAWVGLWTAVLLFLCAVTEASNLIRYLTRFTDEIFAGLMSLIYIAEALKNIAKAFESGLGYAHALLSLVLALGTFYLASQLSRLRRTKLLVPAAREFLADFGPAIAILAMTGVAIWLHPVALERLAVPEALGTTSGRPWLINPFDAPVWVWGASLVPALLVTTLLYFDQNITTRLVASPDNKLKKGAGFHLDMAVVAVCVGFTSLLGLPWMVAATVRTLNHVRSLATIETHGGEETIVAVRETRLTGVLVHLAIGGSLFVLPLLAQVPMSVLFGLFLFMGVASMRNNQMFERALLMVTDPSMYPPTHYLRRVPRRVVHLFTLVQAVCLAVLWAVKVSPLGLLFPLFIALLIPVRLLLGRFFDRVHLGFLDAEEAPTEEEMRELL